MPATATTKITVHEVGAGRPHVQGITSQLDDLELRGRDWKAEVGDALTEGTLDRTMEGASALTISVHDDDRKLLESELLQAPFSVGLDGLRFAYVKAAMQGISSPLALTFEDAEVARLRRYVGPVKAFRSALTRAEFINRLRLKAGKGIGGIPFFCPELHKIQPIKTARDSRAAKVTSDTNRGGGLSDVDGDRLTVKGADASGAQLQMGDRVMRIAVSYGAPDRALQALVVACIVESEMSNVSGGTSSSTGILQLLDMHGSVEDRMDVERSVRLFLTEGFTGQGGAIELAKGGMSPPEIAQAVQGSGVNAYGSYAREAAAWVEAFGGGGASGSLSITSTTRYAYEVKKNESYWDAMQRLAKEVGWRCFVSAGKLYFCSDPYLMRSRLRIEVDDMTAGVEDMSFDYDLGKEINEVTLQVRAKAWAAPPGTVVLVKRCGPANGRYLVSTISAPLRRHNSLCSITLRRPVRPLPEPAPKTKTSTRSLGSSASASSASGAPAAVDKMIAEIDRIVAKKLPYVWGGGHVNPPPGNPSGYDCSGFVSRVLYVGGLIDGAVVSGALAGMYQAGSGEWLTIYANSTHTFGRIRTPTGWRYFESGGGGNGGHWAEALDTGGMSARHPKGY